MLCSEQLRIGLMQCQNAHESGASSKAKFFRQPSGKFASVDLNLLVALDALLAYRNVTHAARRLGQTQPAVSRSLGKLRELLADDLLVRGSSGMKLTARGEYLAQIVPQTMSHVRDVVSSRQVDPVINVTVDRKLMPALFSHFMRSSSDRNERFKLDVYKTVYSGIDNLAAHSTDFLLGPRPKMYAGVESKHILNMGFVTLVGVDHRIQGSTRSNHGAFRDFDHIRILENGMEIYPEVAEAKFPCSNKPARFIDVPDVTSAALIVSKSRSCLTVPKFVAAWLTKMVPLAVMQPLIDIPEQEISLSWMSETHVSNNKRLIADICNTTRMVLENDCLFPDLYFPSTEVG